jgi:hypothetical protein
MMEFHMSPAAGLKSGQFNQKRNFVLDLPFEVP